MTVTRTDLANAIRALSMDAVQKANSGHPGMPMGMADIAEVLWNDYLAHNPANPAWANRDRFMLSNGHGSMLHYSLLHLAGYDLPMEELKNFRQLHSKTPGHPEYGYAPGIETTTGPLGQGLTNAVGMALAEQVLAAQFNKPGHAIVDHFTYVFLGDGCLMEGISHEACSLAGTWGLGKLVCFYDDNGISIDGHIDDWFTDDTPKRFEAYGWQVIANVDGHNAQAIKAAIEQARADLSRPTMICCKTVIGKGSPNKAGSHDCHGAALGDAEIALTRENIGWPHAPFEIPPAVYQGWNARDKGAAKQAEWDARFAAYAAAFPAEAAELKRRIAGDLPKNWQAAVNELVESFRKEVPNIASRVASGNTIAAFAKVLPEFIGGSADLAPSNNTKWKEAKAILKGNMQGNYLHYGVREFGMAAIMNGMALHGSFVPFGGTFLIFSDYARNAIRMSALMKQRVIYVLTHDSVGLGEDGPTHQPIEQVNSLRLIPNMTLWRPCDAVETAVAWAAAIENSNGPACLILSRQNLPAQAHSDATVAGAARGGYILSEAGNGQPEGIIIATGSEVSLAMAAQAKLAEREVYVRVVSMPSLEVFEKQDASYRAGVLPSKLEKRLAVEAGTTALWYKYVGINGAVIGIDRFGESAPAGLLFKEFGFTTENVVSKYLGL